MFEKSDQRKNVSGYVEYVDTLKQLIRQHSTKSHGSRRRRKRWWDGEVQAAIQLRKELNRQHRFALHTGSSHEIAEKWKMYQEQKNATKQLVQQKLAAAHLNKIREIRSSGKDAPRKFWKYLGTLDGGDQTPVIIDERTGLEVNALDQCLTEHLMEVFAPQETALVQTITIENSTECTLASSDEKIGLVSIVRALAHVKSSTAPGLDEIPACALKTLQKDSREHLAEIFTDILIGRQPVPRDWRRGRVVLVPKKGGDRRYLRNCRPLTVTSIVYRAFAGILKERMTTWAEKEGILTELQVGFRRGRRLEDNVYTLTQCIEVARKEERRLICTFLDVSKAYDSVPHDKLLSRLEQLEMPTQWTELINRLYTGNTVTTQVEEVRTEEIVVTRGSRQGCPLSSLLYMLYVARLEERLIKSGLGFSLLHVENGEAVNWVLPGLTFADDIRPDCPT
ncbi:hypothetical protein ISCGN_006556 [Ixodes scapularis]